MSQQSVGFWDGSSLGAQITVTRLHACQPPLGERRTGRLEPAPLVASAARRPPGS